MWFITASRRWKLQRAGAKSLYMSVKTGSGTFRIHYFVAGSGPSIVLVHGVNGSGEYWADLAPRLVAAGFRVYIPDLLGFGRSQSPDVDYAVRLQAEVLDGLLRALRVEDFRIVGVSLGGWVSLYLAQQRAESTKGLVLLNSAGTSVETTVNMGLFSPATIEELDELLQILMPGPARLPRFIARDLVRTLGQHGWVVRRTMSSIFTRKDLLTDEQLHSIKAATLLLWGAEDRLIPLSNGENLQRSIAGAELQVLAGCGHAILETRGEEVMRRVLEFLDRVR